MIIDLKEIPKANVGSSVKDADEPDIGDRVEKHNGHGFMGFYSTITASSLADKVQSLKKKVETDHFDSTGIIRELLRNRGKNRLVGTYLPISLCSY